jgi:hypothetical protein
MNKLIDVTHTVKASAAPSEGARYMLDTATNERFWVEQGTVPAPQEPEVPLEPEPEVKTKGKKLHHG